MAFGTGTQVLSTTAAQLPNHPCSGVIINNDDAAIAVLIGATSGAQNLKLAAANQSGFIPVRNSNLIWVKSASGTPTVSFLWL
jgi:hypothetical protein